MTEYKFGNAIHLDAETEEERLKQWKPFKEKGFRVLDPDGVTVWHESEAIKRLILKAFQSYDADIFLFGSRATGDETCSSDYDIGYSTDASLNASFILTLQENLEELPIPNHVDLVDFMTVPVKFKEIATEGGIVIWKKRSKNSLFI